MSAREQDYFGFSGFVLLPVDAYGDFVPTAVLYESFRIELCCLPSERLTFNPSC